MVLFKLLKLNLPDDISLYNFPYFFYAVKKL